MKKHTFLALLILILNASCQNSSVAEMTEIAVVIDQTDPLLIKPNPEEIINQLNIDENIWQGIRLTVGYVSDMDVNGTTIIQLPRNSRLTGNSQIRKAAVERFKMQVRSCFKITDFEKSKDHSIIYRTMAKHLNTLAASTANAKILLVYSNLMENSEVRFYDTETLSMISKSPEAIQKKLDKQLNIRNAEGVRVWFIYKPSSFEDNSLYMTIARFYKQILERKGATVHIEQSLYL